MCRYLRRTRREPRRQLRPHLGQIWPDFGNSCASWIEHRPDLGQTRQNIARNRLNGTTNVVQGVAEFGHIWTMSAKIDPNLAKDSDGGRICTTSGCNIDHIRTTSTEFGQTSRRLGPESARFGRARPNLDQVGPNVDQFRANSAEFDPVSTNLSPGSVNFGRDRPTLAQVRPPSDAHVKVNQKPLKSSGAPDVSSVL